jgi:hypothetical protein
LNELHSASRREIVKTNARIARVGLYNNRARLQRGGQRQQSTDKGKGIARPSGKMQGGVRAAKGKMQEEKRGKQ